MRPSVIVPSTGPPERLARLLDSLRQQTVELEAIVVDNASPGEAVSRLCDDYGFATPLRLERNSGFTVPMNLAARHASGDVLVMLNDDCVCDPPFVERIAAALEPAAGVVMAAGVTRDHLAPELVDSAGMELDATLLVYDYLNGEPLASVATAPDPIGPSAKAAAFDRDAFLAAGGFDERLFAYWEDVDLVLRLRRDGGECRLAREALATHEHSATLGSGSAAKNYLTGFGRGYVLRKWGVMTPRRIAGVLARELVIVAGQAVIDRNATGLRGRVRGWRAATTREPYPDEVAVRGGGSSLLRTMKRRLVRRRRLARGAPPA